MSELAFNANGEVFEVPATVTGWRVRRMKPRGAPELVYGKDGRPLTVGIEADIDELRDAVGTAGKYRLDPVNDDGKCVENVPAAYVQVVKPQRNGEATSVAVATTTASDDTLREAMRLNTELAKSVIDRFPEMMHAAAELLRAADGAGLPARQPREADEDDEEDDAIGAPARGSGFAEVIAQVIPPLVMALASGDKSRLPNLAEMLDWRKAVPKNKPKADVPASEPATAPSMPLDAMARVAAVLDQLTPEERTLAMALAQELSTDERMKWFAELAPLSNDEALLRVRKLLSSTKGAGGVS